MKICNTEYEWHSEFNRVLRFQELFSFKSFYLMIYTIDWFTPINPWAYFYAVF